MIEMTIEDLLYDYVNVQFLVVELFELNSGSVIYQGYGDEIPEDYFELTVESWELLESGDGITINVISDEY